MLISKTSCVTSCAEGDHKINRITYAQGIGYWRCVRCLFETIVRNNHRDIIDTGVNWSEAVTQS